MRDYNFFEIYEKKKGIRINPKSTVFVCGVLLILLVLATLGFVGRNFYLNSEIDAYNEKLNQITASKEYVEANRLQESIIAMDQYDKDAEMALTKFQNSNLIGTEVMATISSAVPSQATLETMTINNAFLSSTFVVTDRKTASELILNLKGTELFKEVHLSSLAINEGGSYDANIQCILKEKQIESKEGEE